MLCLACKEIFSHYCNTCAEVFAGTRQASYHRLPHHASLQDFTKARDEGCQICGIVHRSLMSSMLDQQDNSHDSGTIYFIQKDRRKPQHFHVHIGLGSDKSSSVSIDVRPAQELGHDPHHRPCQRSAEGPPDHRQALEWIANCNANHKECVSRQKAKWKPTRLVFVGSSEDEIRLVECESEVANVECSRYTTLSHCWGLSNILKLTKDNRQALKSRIDIAKLPKTFQHAITVTRALQSEYLWVDSLCIIQDDLDDWRRESSKMSDVYQYSYCNIAATGAPDGSTGLFFDRETTAVETSIVHPAWPETSGTAYAVFDLTHTVYWEFAVQPLLSRAWVVQERVLAPRAIHYGKLQLFWECKEVLACEGLPSGLPIAQDTNAQYGTYFKTWTDPKRFWYEIVSCYSKCDLTRSGDKLVAISGVARFAHGWVSATHDVYLAGVWQAQLPHTLLWYPLSRSGARLYAGSDYRAPSWSWASRDGEITWLSSARSITDPRYRALAALESHSLKHPGPDVYGEVVSGHLCIRGPLSRVLIERIMIDESPQDRIKGVFDAEKNIMTLFTKRTWAQPSVAPADRKIQRHPLNKDTQQTIDVNVSGLALMSMVMFDDEPQDLFTEKGDELVVFAFALCDVLPAKVGNYQPGLDGLLLKQNVQGSFERIGIFDIRVDDGGQDELRSLFKETVIELV